MPNTTPNTIMVVPVNYPVTGADIEARRAEYAALSCETREGYEATRRAIAYCRKTRVEIEARRKELKADSLEYGRRVDAVAKELTGLITSLEDPLQAKKDVVDEAAARAKREREEAERAALEASVRAAREAEEAKLRAEREAEEQRLAVERAALAAERTRLIEQQRVAEEAAREVRAREQARLDAERAALAAERQAIEDGRRQAAAEEAARQATLRAEADAKARAERARLEAEEASIREAELAARREALRPDADKLRGFAGRLRAVEVPTVGPAAHDAVAVAIESLFLVAAVLEDAARALDGRESR